MLYIGIDPGTHTGMAVWDSKGGAFLSLETIPIHKALAEVEILARGREDIMVIFEDARLRTWYGTGNTNARLQGAGSVKRDCAIWEDFCTDKGIAFQAVHPLKGATKLTSAYFKTITGWKGRASEHARDAAMLVFGR